MLPVNKMKYTDIKYIILNTKDNTFFKDMGFAYFKGKSEVIFTDKLGYAKLFVKQSASEIKESLIHNNYFLADQLEIKEVYISIELPNHPPINL